MTCFGRLSEGILSLSISVWILWSRRDDIVPKTSREPPELKLARPSTSSRRCPSGHLPRSWLRRRSGAPLLHPGAYSPVPLPAQYDLPCTLEELYNGATMRAPITKTVWLRPAHPPPGDRGSCLSCEDLVCLCRTQVVLPDGATTRQVTETLLIKVGAVVSESQEAGRACCLDTRAQPG